jgi:general secretion pathway protein J
MKIKAQGFTLIEILIALTIFAILAAMTASSLYYAFNTRTRVNESLNQLDALQTTIIMLRQDTLQTVVRPILGNEMHSFSAFIGQPEYMEFTRDGFMNPGSVDKRSTLKRIAYVCEGSKLLRRTWAMLDVPNRSQYEDRVLLTDLTECQFHFLNYASELLPEWRPQTTGKLSQPELLPKAIQVSLKPKVWGKALLLLPIPGVLYGAV